MCLPFVPDAQLTQRGATPGSAQGADVSPSPGMFYHPVATPDSRGSSGGGSSTMSYPHMASIPCSRCTIDSVRSHARTCPRSPWFSNSKSRYSLSSIATIPDSRGSSSDDAMSYSHVASILCSRCAIGSARNHAWTCPRSPSLVWHAFQRECIQYLAVLDLLSILQHNYSYHGSRNQGLHDQPNASKEVHQYVLSEGQDSWVFPCRLLQWQTQGYCQCQKRRRSLWTICEHHFIYFLAYTYIYC